MLQLHSTPELSGQLAPLSERLETRLIADLAGLSVLLKPCPIEFASLLMVQLKQEFLLKISHHAALLAVMVATEVIQVLPGNTSNLPVLFLEVFMAQQPPAVLTNWLHALTTLPVQSIQLAHQLFQLLSAPLSASAPTEKATARINPTAAAFTASPVSPT